jgi:hypothetical protein
LVDGQEYVVIRLEDIPETARNESDWIKLAQTEQKAIDGQGVDLKADTVGLPTAVNSKAFSGADVNAASNSITLANPAFTGSGVNFSLLGQTFELGQAVVYHQGDAAIAGLVDGETYYIIAGIDEYNLSGDQRFVGEQVIQLAETENEARGGVAIDIGPVSSSATGFSLAAKHVLDSGFATGIGVQSKLDASDKASGGAGLNSEDRGPKTFAKKVEAVKEKLNPNVPDLIFQALTKDYRDNSSKTGSGSSGSLSVAGGLAVVVTDHDVITTVGADAKLKSNEDLEVTSRIRQTYQLTAEADTEPQGNASGASAGESAANTVSVSVSVGVLNNKANAIVESGADLDALRATRVISNITYPFLTRPDAFVPTTCG